MQALPDGGHPTTVADVRAAVILRVGAEDLPVVAGPLSGDEGIAVANYAKEHPDKTFVNGIAASDDGRLLFLGDHRGAQVMDVASRAVRAVTVPAGETLAGIDGLYVRGRTLVAVQNGVRNRAERVVQAELSPSLDAVIRMRLPVTGLHSSVVPNFETRSLMPTNMTLAAKRSEYRVSLRFSRSYR